MWILPLSCVEKVAYVFIYDVQFTALLLKVWLTYFWDDENLNKVFA